MVSGFLRLFPVCHVASRPDWQPQGGWKWGGMPLHVEVFLQHLVHSEVTYLVAHSVFCPCEMNGLYHDLEM